MKYYEKFCEIIVMHEGTKIMARALETGKETGCARANRNCS